MDKSEFRDKREMKPWWGHMQSAVSISGLCRQDRCGAPGAGAVHPVEGDKDEEGTRASLLRSG